MENVPAIIETDYRVVNIEDFAMTAERVVGQARLIQEVMEKLMKKDEHFGTIPGTKKPSLYKPGAEKLSVTFRLVPKYEIKQTDLSHGHREYQVVCTLIHAPTGQFFGQGVGSCTTMEGKYRYRKAEQKCPECGKEGTVIKGKNEYGGGWLCYQKKGGCGAKFKDGDERVENQNMGRVEHDNPADYYNTVLKMAKKRAHVDAVLTATAASDIFTQDVEDMPEVIKAEPAQEQPKKDPVPKAPAKAKPKPKMDKAQFDFIVTCQKAKNHLGQEKYYEVLGQHGFEHCTDVPNEAKEAIVTDLRITAKKMVEEKPIYCPTDGQMVETDYCDKVCNNRQGCPAWDNQKGA